MRKALTLLEMLLVLAVLAVMAGMMLPAVDRMYRTHRLRQAGNDLRAKLAATRLHAIDDGIAYQFRFEPGGRRLVVVPDQPASLRFGESTVPIGGGRIQPAAWSFSAQLPEGVVFAGADRRRERLAIESLHEIADAGDLARLSWSAPVLFTPNGRSSTAEFYLRGEDGRGVRLTVRSLTGSATCSGIQAWHEP